MTGIETVAPTIAREVDQGAVPLRTGAVHLTGRGRALLVLVVAVLLTAAFSLGRVSSDAAGPASAVTRRTVVVRPGQTVWQIAAQAAPESDSRVTVRRILDINNLGDAEIIRAGQRLALP